ncbi:MAG TPA: plastocyanin/azurin family copper-binding protein [Gemmatimonadales bacterium]|nr:plastocyanin/azurin family copper-binding protein [Gemmatimonadales bacterium]
MLSRPTGVLVLTLSLAGLACSSSTDYGSGGGGSNPPPPSDVAIVSGAEFKTNTAFNPNPFTAALNGGASVTVKWGNGDGTTHKLLANGASPAFSSGNIAPGQTFSATFTAAGTYAYHCTIHPNMVGSIVVNP